MTQKVIQTTKAILVSCETHPPKQNHVEYIVNFQAARIMKMPLFVITGEHIVDLQCKKKNSIFNFDY